MRRHTAWLTAGALLTTGLVAGCSSSGSGSSAGAACNIADSPTSDGDSYTITLQAPSADFEQTATVTITGGLDSAPVEEPLNTAIPVTGDSGAYTVTASIRPSSTAPSGTDWVTCTANIYIP
ncbi:MAG TPA: hypothetical protein VFN97_06750 [Actinospica sp.]|nr:hypothetical protein [Actinospica sp.]